jgi:ABC-type multidrug transport system fused ATPase/permease subunit
VSRGMMINSSTVPEQRAPFARSLRRVHRLVAYVRPYWRTATLGVAAMLGATAAGLVTPYLIKVAIDRGITPGDTEVLVAVVAAFIVINVLAFVLQAGQTYWVGWAGERVLTDLRSDLYTHLQRLELGFYERTRAGVLISRLTNDVEALQQLVTDGVTSTVSSTLSLVGTAVILFVLDWRLALATMLVFPLMALATFVFRHYSARAYRRMRERLGHVTATLQEDLTGVRVVQAFRREDSNLARFLGVNGAYRQANQTTVYSNAYYFPAVGLLSNLGTVIVFGYGGWLYIHGEVGIGTLVAFTGYLANFFDPVQQLSQLYNTFLAATAALDKIFDVMDVEPRLVDRPGAVDVPIEGAVRLDDVHFAYREGREVIHGLDLDVPAGTTVALVGHTGAGKSTIVKLLARFYDPTEGAITIDGRDLRDFTRSSLRRQMALVPQEGFLFAGTVRENIAYGRPSATLDEVQAAAAAVGADAFIQRLELGYDTPVGERGARLSIGQRQLIAFARALLVDPRILILDEATSSVDIATEERIEEALRTLLAGRTAFVVAHRLSTIRRAGLIVVLENGVVVEQGTHDELIARQGRYQSLYGDWKEAVA